MKGWRCSGAGIDEMRGVSFTRRGRDGNLENA